MTVRKLLAWLEMRGTQAQIYREANPLQPPLMAIDPLDLLRLIAYCRRLEDALMFYASESNWRPQNGMIFGEQIVPTFMDMGKLASAALSEQK